MRKTFLLTSILLLSASWMLAQYSSGSSPSDQPSTTSQGTGAFSGSSAGEQTGTTDEMNQGAQPSSKSSADEPQSSGGNTQQGSRGESMSSQQGESSSDMSSQGMSSGTSAKAKAGATQTFQGCLSEENGKFHLTDNMGTSYELTGKTASLKAHVGHEVAITGKATGSRSNAPGAMSGEQPSAEQQTIQVSSFRHISSTCKSGAMGAPGATGASPQTH